MAASFSLAFGRSGTFVPMAGLRSAFGRSRIQFRPVGGQVEECKLVLVLSRPCLDWLAVTDSQVVENKEHLLAGILARRCKEFDQRGGVECFVNDHPACLARMRHRGNHRQFLPRTTNRMDDRATRY